MGKLSIGLLATVLVIGGAVGVHGRSSTSLSAQPKKITAALIKEWARLVDTHEPGRIDAAVLTVAPWQAIDLYNLCVELKQLKAFKYCSDERSASSGVLGALSVLGVVHSSRSEPRPTLKVEVVEAALGLRHEEVRSPAINRLLLRAALLHTDAAVLTEPVGTEQRVSPFTGKFTVLGRDGHQIGTGDPTWHLEFAAVVLDGLWPDVAADARALAWYDAAAVHLLRVSWISEAEWLLGRATEIFPTDARLRFLTGTVNETYAMPRHQHASREVGSVLPMEVRLTGASWSFEKAVELDPDLVEARLHAGRVAGQLGRHDRALEHLRLVQYAVHDPVLRYYAALFLGFEQDETRDVAAARASYLRASELFPEAQSPRLALSALARRTGDTTLALNTVQQLLSLTNRADQEELDPWWWYERSHVRDADERLAAWRAQVPAGAVR